MAFAWIPAHKAIADYLYNGYTSCTNDTQRHDFQKQMIADLKSIGVNVAIDYNPKGTEVPLDEIDPFTFIRHFYKRPTLSIEFLNKYLSKISSNIKVVGVKGVPTGLYRNTWLYPYKFDRHYLTPSSIISLEIERLWYLFIVTYELLINNNNNHLTITDFDKAFKEALKNLYCGRKSLGAAVFKLFYDNINQLNNSNYYENINLIINEQTILENTNTDCKIYPLNQILYGPPGTGKTYHTVKYAAEIIRCEKFKDEEVNNEDNYKEAIKIFNYAKKENRIRFVTFHQSFSYEDFIQGIRPDVKNDSQTLKFKNNNGIFKDIVEDAKKYPYNNYVLIIDEINRANISRVFGELITLIEEDKRMNYPIGNNEVDWSVTLPVGDNSKDSNDSNDSNKFFVPKNLYILGTMNTADKSIALLDVALRRRFTFIPMYPDSNLVNKNYKNYFEELNKKIIKEIGVGRGYDLQIGHSYFMFDSNDNTEICENFEKVMNNKVIPLLMEYFMNDVDAVKKLLESQELRNINILNTNIKLIEGFPLQIKLETNNAAQQGNEPNAEVQEATNEATEVIS